MADLTAGDLAPAIDSVDQEGKRITLEEYRKDDTPGCIAESCDLRDNYEQFLKQEFEVIGVSADREKSHQKFIAKHTLPFRLIADTKGRCWKISETVAKRNCTGKPSSSRKLIQKSTAGRYLQIYHINKKRA